MPTGERPPLPLFAPWLEPWLSTIRRVGIQVLELGCGQGQDAAFLTGAGLSVVAFDRSLRTLEAARQLAPEAQLLLADLSLPLPFREASFDAAVASLSMHYLHWRDTLDAFAEVRRVLKPGAPFVFRVNATDDVHHGAGQGEEVEPNLFRASGGRAELKRFFSRDDVVAALGERFAAEQLRHVTIHRYELPKQTWECVATAR